MNKNQNAREDRQRLEVIENKIKIFEDFSDRIEKEHHQLIELLDKKSLHLQKKIQIASSYIEKVEKIIQKSFKALDLFQNKIPYEKLAEKQKTSSYIKAAERVHSGASIEEIAEEIDLPRKEIELIYKINRRDFT